MKIILFAFLIILPASAIAVCQTHQTAGMKGKVYATHFGALLSDVEIKLLRDGKVITSARADKEGSYSISNISAGAYSVLIEAPGFIIKRLSIGFAEGEQKMLDIDVEIWHIENYSTPPEFSITGTVGQSNGTPIPGASVVIVSPFSGNRMSETRTDEKGRYKALAMEGQFLVYASRPGFLVRCTSVLLRVVSTPEQRTINFVLEPFGSK